MAHVGNGDRLAVDIFELTEGMAICFARAGRFVGFSHDP